MRSTKTPARMPDAPTRTALVFGASGQIGAALLARLAGGGWQAFAVSRVPRPPAGGVTWLTGEFANVGGLPEAVDVVFSTGPLDGFAQWYARGQVATRRVVAFGSTSLDTKQTSADAHERDIVARLQAAERLVFDTASANGAAATVLRPTLVYGAGRDQTLARIAAMARRVGFFVLPRGAEGKRQPVPGQQPKSVGHDPCGGVGAAARQGQRVDAGAEIDGDAGLGLEAIEQLGRDVVSPVVEIELPAIGRREVSRGSLGARRVGCSGGRGRCTAGLTASTDGGLTAACGQGHDPCQAERQQDAGRSAVLPPVHLYLFLLAMM